MDLAEKRREDEDAPSCKVPADPQERHWGCRSFTSPVVIAVMFIFTKQNRREVLHVLLLGTKAVPHGSRVDVLDPTQAMFCPQCAALAACIFM